MRAKLLSLIEKCERNGRLTVEAKLFADLSMKYLELIERPVLDLARAEAAIDAALSERDTKQ